MTGSGYRPCACRDCMEVAIGDAGSMCHHCVDAGCDSNRECQAAGAYGGEPEECEDNACTGCSWCDAQPATPPATPIHAACEAAGFYVVTEGSEHPEHMITRMLTVLFILDTEDRMHASVTGPGAAVPAAAMTDAQHAFWASAEARLVIEALTIALDALAPAGFRFTAEGTWSRLGFFR
jgi:hypothetical protein